jgi:Domain of unknown function (DUF4170)
MAEFWVVGGEYADAKFETLRAGGKLETFGPFPTYEAAHKEWHGRTMQTIDNAMMRYRIVNDRPRAA